MKMLQEFEPRLPLFQSLVEQLNRIYHANEARGYDRLHPEIHAALPRNMDGNVVAPSAPEGLESPGFWLRNRLRSGPNSIGTEWFRSSWPAMTLHLKCWHFARSASAVIQVRYSFRTFRRSPLKDPMTFY